MAVTGVTAAQSDICTSIPNSHRGYRFPRNTTIASNCHPHPTLCRYLRAVLKDERFGLSCCVRLKISQSQSQSERRLAREKSEKTQQQKKAFQNPRVVCRCEQMKLPYEAIRRVVELTGLAMAQSTLVSATQEPVDLQRVICFYDIRRASPCKRNPYSHLGKIRITERPFGSLASIGKQA
jgi:hypothetical protein